MGRDHNSWTGRYCGPDGQVPPSELTAEDRAVIATFTTYLTRLGPRDSADGTGTAVQRAFRAWHHQDPSWACYLGIQPTGTAAAGTGTGTGERDGAGDRSGGEC